MKESLYYAPYKRMYVTGYIYVWLICHKKKSSTAIVLMVIN